MLFELGIGIKLVNKLTSPLKQVNRDLNETTRTMRQLDTVTGKLSHGLSRLQQTVQKASLPFKQLRDQARAIREASTGLVFRGTATAAISLVPAFSAMGFEKGLAEVATLTDMSVAQFREKYGNRILDLAKELGEDELRVVGAMYQAISAGIDPEEAIGFLKSAGKAAIAGVSDIFTSVDFLTTIKNSFNIPATEMAKVSDVIFQTVKKGKTTFKEIADSFAEVGASASIAGVSLEHVQAAVARMTLSGVKTPSAYIKIKYALESLSAPTNQAKKMFQELGLTINAETLKQNDLLGTMDMIAQQIEKLPFAKQAEAISNIFSSMEAQEFFKDFMGNRDKYKEMVREIKNSTGATEGAYKKMADTADKEFKRTRQAIKSLTIMAGSALLPAFNRALGLFTKVLQPIAMLSQRFPKATGAVLGLVTAVGLLAAGLGALGWGLSFVMNGIAAFKTFIGVVQAMNLAFLASPITWIILAIAAGAFLIIKYWKPIKKFFKSLWEGIVSAFKWAKNALSKPFKLAFDYSPIGIAIRHIKQLSKINLFEAGKKIVSSLWSGIKAAAMKPVEAVKGVVQRIRNLLPFSPAKEGPLKDINKIKLVETIAENVKPEPLKNAMSKVLDVVKNIPLPLPAFAGSHGGSGTVTVNYSPNVYINGASPQAKDDFMAMLKQHKDELLKMIRDAQMKQARLAY